MKKQIPNLITLGNLMCGVLACIHAVDGALDYAALFICAGIFFDFFDGLAARALGVSSPLGKELDSLADVITSGVAPGLMLFAFFRDFCEFPLLFLVGLLIPAFSAYRLAKFNLDTRQTHSFLGLPTPANALVWVGLALWLCYPQISLLSAVTGFDETQLAEYLSEAPWGAYVVPLWICILIAVVSLLLDILLISEIPLFALKIKNLSWSDNKLRYLFILSAIILILLFGGMGISLTILWYVVLSVITRQKPEEA